MEEVDYSRYSILVVDDIPVNVLLVKSMLSKYKFNVTSANNGRDALNAVAQSMPDVILLDVMMPGMNGFEVTKALRNDAKTQFIPVIILSALNSDADIKEGLSAGANDFITKPFIQERIVNSILNQINLAETRQGKSQEDKQATVGTDEYLTVLSYMACMGQQPAVFNVLRHLAVGVPASMLDSGLFQTLADSAAGGEDALQAAVRGWLTQSMMRYTLKKEQVTLSSCIEKAVSALAPVAVAKGIVWAQSVDSSMRVNADVELLQPVITNLLTCACGISTKGTVNVSGNMENGYFTVSVSGKGSSNAGADWNFNLSLAQDVIAKLEGTIWIKQLNDKDFHFQLIHPL